MLGTTATGRTSLVANPVTQLAQQQKRILRTQPIRGAAEHYSTTRIPTEFVVAFHEALNQGIRDTDAIRTFLSKRFAQLQPESQRNMLIEATLEAMCELPAPHANIAQQNTLARQFAGQGITATEVQFVETDELQQEVQFVKAACLAEKAIMMYSPDKPPMPPPSTSLTTSNKPENKPMRFLKGQNENELEEPATNAIAAAEAALAELQRKKAAFQRICAAKKAREERIRREHEEAVQATLALVEAFPIEEMNTEIASKGHDMKEETLTAINYKVPTSGIRKRVTLGEVFQRIHNFAKGNKSVNDMTVHVMALFTIICYISERFHIDGSLNEKTLILVRRLRYLSTFKHYGSDSNLQDHSHIMRPRQEYVAEEEEREYGPIATGIISGAKKIDSFLGTLYSAAEQFTKALNPQMANYNTKNEVVTPEPVTISESTIFIDLVLENYLNETIHPSILCFLFPPELYKTRDVNLFLHGHIVQLLYDNGLDKYLDMRSMCISLYKHIDRIIKKFFWKAPAPPSMYNKKYASDQVFFVSPTAELVPSPNLRVRR